MERFDYQQQLDDERRQRMEEAREWRMWSENFGLQMRQILRDSRKAWDKWAKKSDEQEKR